jgi:hypothetical protein
MTIQPTVNEIMTFLRPNGWAVWDNDFSTAVYFDDVEPITLAEYEQGEKDFIAAQIAKELETQTAKAAAQAKLAALGLTTDDLKALGL